MAKSGPGRRAVASALVVVAVVVALASFPMAIQRVKHSSAATVKDPALSQRHIHLRRISRPVVTALDSHNQAEEVGAARLGHNPFPLIKSMAIDSTMAHSQDFLRSHHTTLACMNTMACQ